jgi:hypothetical protein
MEIIDRGDCDNETIFPATNVVISSLRHVLQKSGVAAPADTNMILEGVQTTQNHALEG